MHAKRNLKLNQGKGMTGNARETRQHAPVQPVQLCAPVALFLVRSRRLLLGLLSMQRHFESRNTTRNQIDSAARQEEQKNGNNETEK